MKLTHWIDNEYVESAINGKFTFSSRVSHKPIGLWLSVNGGWEDFVKYNWEGWSDNKTQLRARVAPDIKLFVITSKDCFLKKWKQLMDIDYKDYDYKNLKRFHSLLKEKYDGIYLTERAFLRYRISLDFGYFYSWDCASMCIWNTDKVKLTTITNKHGGV